MADTKSNELVMRLARRKEMALLRWAKGGRKLGDLPFPQIATAAVLGMSTLLSFSPPSLAISVRRLTAHKLDLPGPPTRMAIR